MNSNAKPSKRIRRLLEALRSSLRGVFSFKSILYPSFESIKPVKISITAEGAEALRGGPRVTFGYRMWYRWRRLLRYSGVVLGIFSSVYLIVLTFVWPVFIVYAWAAWAGLSMYFSDYGILIRISFVILCLGFGFILYEAREELRSIYGLVEILLGSLACWSAAGQPADKIIAATTALAAGIYLIVRGIDNFRVGLEERRPFKTHAHGPWC